MQNLNVKNVQRIITINEVSLGVLFEVNSRIIHSHQHPLHTLQFNKINMLYAIIFTQYYKLNRFLN